MKKNGFTLIEVLSVIIVLAIIALIATPITLNIVEESRKSAAKASANGYIEAIEYKASMSALAGNAYENKDDYVYDEISVDVSGTLPTGGMYSLKDKIVTSAVFCIDGYEISYSDSKTEVSGTCKGEDLKLNGSVKLSQSSGYYAYPESGTFEVTENISGGALSCTSSDTSVADCSISGTTVTVIPGVATGSAILTIKSEGSSKYKEAQASYVVTTEKGLLSYTANGYSGVYDKEAHGIVVSSPNAIIKYGIEEGNYTLDDSPTYTDAGEYTVYFEITKVGYNTITGSKPVTITKANGNLKLEEKTGTVGYDKTISVGIKENTSGGEVSVDVTSPDIVEANIVDGKLNIKANQIGVTTITLTSAETNNYTASSTEYKVTVITSNNTLTLSSNTGSYTYPESGTFEVIENISGGSLSCTSDNTSVADCSISGTTVTVTPGTESGSATLTIKSAATTNYKEGQAAYVAVTASGTLSVTATGYSGTYDGSAHGITVTSSGATIKYGVTSGTYDLTTSPTYTNVGEYTVYYQITKEGYNTVTGSKTVTITKASGSITSPTAKSLTYTGSVQELVTSGSTSTGTIEYKLDNGTYSTIIPTATSVGTYTVYYRVVGDLNHNDVEEQSLSVIIQKANLNYTTGGYSGVYDGSAHGITVISSEATIQYGTKSGTYDLATSPTYTDAGTYTVYYQITKEGYNTVTGSKTVTITTSDNTLTLSSNTGNYTYPTSGTFEVTTNVSKGSLSCTSDNTSVADCSISGTTVTVTPGTTSGSATLTIKSAATTNYNEGQASYVAVTSKGTLSVTATGYSGTYDGSAHGITVTSSGATIKYGTTDGTYDLTTSPTYTNAGTYTVYYQVTKSGYNTVTGSKQVIIASVPTAPTITGGSTEWTQNSKTISVSTDSTSAVGISYYQYCISTSTSGCNGTWTSLASSTKSITVTTEGTRYIYFRAVDKNGIAGTTSAYQITKIDKTSPSVVINSVSRVSGYSMKVLFTASDNESGIKSISCKAGLQIGSGGASSNFTITGTISGNECTFNNLRNYETYDFYIRVTNNVNISFTIYSEFDTPHNAW